IIFRKRELGIRIVLGESLKNIALNFTYENIILSCIAIIANIGFTYLSNINYIKNMQTGSIKANIDINFNLEFFLISIIIIIVLNLINSFVIYKVLKKFQPKELIGGIE
ncbi:MAG: FtsX-like permease family protein, partial [Clostridium celatum]|nr:FtsX-like permease family protein [Clostridium celatum]